jgi:hypothetical protein
MKSTLRMFFELILPYSDITSCLLLLAVTVLQALQGTDVKPMWMTATTISVKTMPHVSTWCRHMNAAALQDSWVRPCATLPWLIFCHKWFWFQNISSIIITSIRRFLGSWVQLMSFSLLCHHTLYRNTWLLQGPQHSSMLQPWKYQISLFIN